jgi:hypothetical protein
LRPSGRASIRLFDDLHQVRVIECQGSVNSIAIDGIDGFEAVKFLSHVRSHG